MPVLKKYLINWPEITARRASRVVISLCVTAIYGLRRYSAMKHLLFFVVSHTVVAFSFQGYVDVSSVYSSSTLVIVAIIVVVCDLSEVVSRHMLR